MAKEETKQQDKTVPAAAAGAGASDLATLLASPNVQVIVLPADVNIESVKALIDGLKGISADNITILTDGVKSLQENIATAKDALQGYHNDFTSFKTDLDAFIKSALTDVIEEMKEQPTKPGGQAITSLTIGTGNSQIIRTGDTPVEVHPGLVNVKISYPEGFKGAKYFKEGDIKPMAKETADSLVNKGIATIV